MVSSSSEGYQNPLWFALLQYLLVVITRFGLYVL